MPLIWNEIKSRALLFTQEWKDEVREDAEAKFFWDESSTFLLLAKDSILPLKTK